MSGNSFVNGMLLVVATTVGVVLMADSGFVSWQYDGSVRIGKPKQVCGYGNCPVGIANPLGSKPSINDFFGSIEGSPSDGYTEHYRLEPNPAPAIPKVPRSYQAPLPNATSGFNPEPQVYYLPIPVPVELPSLKTCI